MGTATRPRESRRRSEQNTPAEIRPAPPTHRTIHDPAAPKPHVTSQLQCYVPALIDNNRRSPLKINRQPRRLEFAISPTKQTPAPQINRQQMRTSHPAFFAGRATSRITHPDISNRHNRHAAPLLINHYSPTCLAGRRVTTHCPSNRHFLHVSASHNHRFADANRPPQAASNIVSYRQWQILEINVNLSKQTIAPRSNRHKNAFITRLENGQFHVQEFFGVFAEVGDQQAEVAAHSA